MRLAIPLFVILKTSDDPEICSAAKNILTFITTEEFETTAAGPPQRVINPILEALVAQMEIIGPHLQKNIEKEESRWKPVQIFGFGLAFGALQGELLRHIKWGIIRKGKKDRLTSSFLGDVDPLSSGVGTITLAMALNFYNQVRIDAMDSRPSKIESTSYLVAFGTTLWLIGGFAPNTLPLLVFYKWFTRQRTRKFVKEYEELVERLSN
jgi:hypothetical protein